MHPVIRIISFLILAGFVAFGGLYELALGFVIVLCIVLLKRFQSIELTVRILKRMRWLFLSILIVYLWFTPGEPIIPITSGYIPTIEGLKTGILRVLSLVLIIFAVNYFISSIARNRLVEAIVWLLHPLNQIGFDSRQLALRIALTLELIPRVQQIVLDLKQHYQDTKNNKEQERQSPVDKSVVLSRVSMMSQLLEVLFERIIDEAVKMPAEKFEVDTMQRPQVFQWFAPVLIIAMFWSAQYLGMLN